MPLTKRAIMWDREGDVYQSGEAIQFEVDGLPASGRTLISRIDCVWKVLRIPEGGPQGQWEGEHASPDAAIAFLEAASDKSE